MSCMDTNVTAHMMMTTDILMTSLSMDAAPILDDVIMNLLLRRCLVWAGL